LLLFCRFVSFHPVYEDFSSLQSSLARTLAQLFYYLQYSSLGFTHSAAAEMSADGEGRNSCQDNQPGQEWIPLREQPPSGETLQVPSNVGSTRMGTPGDGSRWHQKDATSAWAAHGHPQEQPGRKQPSANQRLIQAGSDVKFRKHTLAIWLILTYALIVILSWIITCVLTYQPIRVPTYLDQSGKYSPSRYKITDNWRKAASVGQSIVAVISIPVTSAVCAKAAAMYCQRSLDAKGRILTLKQMLVLADKSWSNISTLFDVARPRTSRHTRSPLLLLSAGLMAVGKSAPLMR